MQVKSLNYYPVKSCAGIKIDSAEIALRGFKHDRSFMLIDSNGVFLSQRKHAKMALIQTSMVGEVLSLSIQDGSSIKISQKVTGDEIQVSVWRDNCQAIDQGDEAANWLSQYLACECRLVSMAKNFIRPLEPGYALKANDHTGFADGFPFLLISQASLDELNSRLDDFLPMNRFRPNIVVEDCAPFAEDAWQQIKIGGVIFEVVKPCVRCGITTIDQETLGKSKEPLKTLAKYRMDKALGGVTFGQNLIHHSTGNIKVGDIVTILS